MPDAVTGSDPVTPEALTGAGFLGGILNNTLIQMVLYQAIGALLSPVLQPYSQTVSNTLWPTDPSVPLSPADLALAVVRNIMTEQQAAAEALLTGMNGDRLHTLTLLTGDAPAPEELAIALRRKLIDQPTYDKGIRQGRLRDEWAPTVQALAVNEPTPETMLQALLEGQLDEATAKQYYQQLGGDPQWFQILFNTQGSAPTPLEAVQMANRGVIPWDGTGPNTVSYQQAFLEGPWRNKWSDPYRALAVYYPPPRTITAMYHEGALTKEQASSYLTKQGVPSELLGAFLFSGSSTKTAAAKQLAESTVHALYTDHLITPAKAKELLGALKYDATEADFVIAVWDAAIQQHWLSLAISRVHSLYVGYRLERAETISALSQIGMDAASVTKAMTEWDLEREANARDLTPADLAAAFKYGYLTADQVLSGLQGLGYSERDAWVFLANHNKSPVGLPPPPPGVSTGPLGK